MHVCKASCRCDETVGVILNKWIEGIWNLSINKNILHSEQRFVVFCITKFMYAFADIYVYFIEQLFHSIEQDKVCNLMIHYIILYYSNIMNNIKVMLLVFIYHFLRLFFSKQIII